MVKVPVESWIVLSGSLCNRDGIGSTHGEERVLSHASSCAVLMLAC